MGIFIIRDPKKSSEHVPHGPKESRWTCGAYGENRQPWVRYDCVCGHTYMTDTLGDGTAPIIHCCANVVQYNLDKDFLFAKPTSTTTVQVLIAEQLKADQRRAAEESLNRAREEFADVPSWGV